MKKKFIKIPEQYNFVFLIILIISSIILSNILQTNLLIKYRLISSILVTISSIIILKKIKIDILNKKILTISGLIALYTTKKILSFTAFNSNNILTRTSDIFNVNYEIIYLLYGIFIFPIIVFYLYLFIKYIIPKVRKFIVGLTKTEKVYLVIIGIIGMITSCFIICTTTAFTTPNSSVIPPQNYDIIYTSDNGAITQKDAYLNIAHEENDVRQPLFGLFSAPFSIFAHMISEFIFFTNTNNSYFFVMIITQFVLTAITTIMLAKLLKLKENEKKLFYLFLTISFPYIIFNIVLEQYAIALFYLVLTIYLYKESKSINYAYLGGVSTLLTTGILFPLITKKEKIKDKINDLMKCLAVFVVVFILSGRFEIIVTLIEKLKFLMSFSGSEVTFLNKIQQFTHFISSLFFAPLGKVVNNSFGIISYQLIPINSLSITGIIILTLCVLSAIINRKDYISKVSIIWVVFSIIMLVIVGWGTKENGLILYSIYFGWAYYILIFRLFQNIFKNYNIFKFAILILIIFMIITSFPELYRIIKFAVTYY